MKRNRIFYLMLFVAISMQKITVDGYSYNSFKGESSILKDNKQLLENIKTTEKLVREKIKAEEIIKEQERKAKLTPLGNNKIEKLNVECTFYGRGDDENGPGRGDVDAVSGRLKEGIIASNNIPLFTKVEITGLNNYVKNGHDVYTVKDTGDGDHIKKDNGVYIVDVFVDIKDNEDWYEYKRRISKLGRFKTKAYIIK